VLLPFFKSNHLPCCHLMNLAREGHKFEMLPTAAVDKRWDTLAALKVKDELAAAADTLRPIVQMSYIKSPKVRSPDYGGSAPVADSSPPKQVVYVRLKRHERANQVVLSSAEKYSYAKAMLEPLMNHLADLSSPDFYRELNAWKETVDQGLRHGKKTSRKRASNDDNDGPFDTSDGGDHHDKRSEADLISAVDPADAMGTAILMDALEDTCMEGSTDAADEQDGDAVPPTQLALVKQEPGITVESSSDNDPDTETDASMEPPRQVDIINVPKPKRRGKLRTALRQLRQTKLPDRLAVHSYPSNLTVSLDQLLVWARNTANMEVVMEMLERYPVQLEDAYLRSRTITCQWELVRPADYKHRFVIPPDLASSMQAEVTSIRNNRRNKPDEPDESVKKRGLVLDIVASIDPKLWKFSG